MDSQNRTALYLACYNCNLAMVRFLVARNADPRIARVLDEKTEETPLGCAVRWGYVEVVSRDDRGMRGRNPGGAGEVLQGGDKDDRPAEEAMQEQGD